MTSTLGQMAPSALVSEQAAGAYVESMVVYALGSPVPPPIEDPVISCTRNYRNRLLDSLHRIFDKDAHATLALLVSHPSGITWTIANNVLTLTAKGDPRQTHALLLTGYATLADLLEAIWPVFTVFCTPGLLSRSPLILLDGSGDSSASNGDHIYAYTSMLWAVLHPWAMALREACSAIQQVIRQIHLHTAERDYLDFHASYYGVRRLSGEADTAYLARLIATVLMARNNNVAIQFAVAAQLGIPPRMIAVVDADDSDYGRPLRFDGTWAFNGAKWLNGRTNAGLLGQYRAQFDVLILVEVAEAIEIAALTETINAYKAAGTRLRYLVQGRPLTFDGTWAFNGAERYNGRIING